MPMKRTYKALSPTPLSPFNIIRFKQKKPQAASAICDSVVNRWFSSIIQKKKSQYHFSFILKQFQPELLFLD